MTIERKMLVRAVIIAVIVGPILIAINQGSDIVAGAGLSYSKTILTMLVPFSVSLVSSLLTSGQVQRSGPPDRSTPRDAGRLLDEILANARKVNSASSAHRREVDAIIATAKKLRASTSGEGPEDLHKSVEEMLLKLDRIRAQADTALEGSAANIQLAQSARKPTRTSC